MAMIDSLLGAHLAETTISGLDGDPERKVRAVQNLHRNLLHTVFGQLRDILDEARDGVSEEDSLTVTRLKTAYYTFISPLQFGAILAGASDEDTEYLAEFGLHAGIAFQIVDDILGTFGNEEDLGKSVSSDILEGKMTLLTIYALAHAVPEDQKVLEAALGNQTITAEVLAECQQILVRTGGLDHAQEVARLELAKARKVLKGAPKSWSKDGREFLESTLHQIEQGIAIQH
jgi:geranylgeranyl pyrophosphate synthase